MSPERLQNQTNQTVRCSILESNPRETQRETKIGDSERSDWLS
jgi:hypothetical protein